MPEIRILHWNIHSWRDDAGAPNVDAVASLLAATAPDVVSLVEVDEPWGGAPVLADLAGRFGYAWVFPPTVHHGDADVPHGGYGNALLVKAPIRAVQQWQLRWPPRLYDGSESSEARTVLLVRLDVGGAALWVGSTHLPRRSAAARSAALERLLTLTGGLDAPWLVCGDFNTAASTWLPADGSVLLAPPSPVPSYPASAPAEPIDYIVAAPSLTVEAEILDRAGSDHLPLIATVTC
ncbi:endonuclease/exonuclease/phosphatase family protein [Jiangella alba]|uniref:Metal-dependent hydrolase, endonuclease/exonuclease/phosphatase family n=1 Tax=Jiangella alba TaxID=561176 RepID=A0A1H5CE97_9ACTN|nr:endonuclease/exonuclease/phosphatase family protein [Jiangella alba]SED65042.1 Metal-dependent hydrolase, endonuclease/exonuclease/phosphatase family [Jiangella alba]